MQDRLELDEVEFQRFQGAGVPQCAVTEVVVCKAVTAGQTGIEEVKAEEEEEEE